MTRVGEEHDDRSDLDRLLRATDQEFRAQAIWFLNASGAGIDDTNCEIVYRMHKKSEDMSVDQEGGTYLDEFSAHRLLEFAQKACTIKEMRECLARMNPNYSKKISLIELLIINFGSDWKEVVNAPQCYDRWVEKKAQDRFDMARAMLENAVNAAKRASCDADTALNAEMRATREQEESLKAMGASRIAELAFSDAKNQAKSALDEFKIQEESIAEKRAQLQHISCDENSGIVKKNKAKAELAMILSEDPLPFQSAKLTQEAAVKMLTRAAKESRKMGLAAEAAMKKSAAARAEAGKAKLEAEAARKVTEAVIPLVKQAFFDVQKALDEARDSKRAGFGTLFYIKRELKEAHKFLPKNRFRAMKEVSDNAFEEATLSIKRRS